MKKCCGDLYSSSSPVNWKSSFHKFATCPFFTLLADFFFSQWTFPLVARKSLMQKIVEGPLNWLCSTPSFYNSCPSNKNSTRKPYPHSRCVTAKSFSRYCHTRFPFRYCDENDGFYDQSWNLQWSDISKAGFLPISLWNPNIVNNTPEKV